jgi:isopenicillin-N epimerase
VAVDKRSFQRNINLIGRKDFLLRTGLLLGGSALISAGVSPSFAKGLNTYRNPSTWKEVKDEFNLDPGTVQLAHFYLTSHPRPVRDEIEFIRTELDKNPIVYIHENHEKHEMNVLKSAADYLGANPDDIALTDSTTMGLGLIYSSLALKPGQEILTTTHDHYSTEISLKLRSERTGAKVRRISLYDFGKPVTSEEIVDRFIGSISPETKYAVVTWVHSCSGMKLPIAKMSKALKEVNKNRSDEDKVIFCVDGVHGLGIENVTLPELGCDIFISGTHKWIFGPRGTGLVWAKPEAWKYISATIPTFSGEAYGIWMGMEEPKELSFHVQMTPGGFHSFEHRWALNKAFEMHSTIGKEKIEDRIHSLNTYTKERLSSMKKIKMITPMQKELSSGIICFEVEGKDPFELVERLWDHKIVASVTPYKTWFVRFSPSLVTLEEDVDKALNVLEQLT